MAKLNVVFGAITNPLRRGFGKVKSMIGGFSGMLLGGLATGLGVVALGIKEIVSSGAKLEQTRVAFEVLLGSAEKANATIKQLREFANITPFDTNSVIEASRGLIATGSAGKELGKEMQMVGDIASGTGKSIGDIAAIYSKMKRLGRLTFEEINQLANSGAVTMEELYKATGKSERSFRRFVESGRADFSIIKKLFEDSTSEGGRFYQMTEKLSKTLGGRFTTAVGKLQMMFADMGEGTTGPMIRVVDAVIRGVDALSKWDALFQSIATSAEIAATAVEVISGKSPVKAVADSYSKDFAPGDDQLSKTLRSGASSILQGVVISGMKEDLMSIVGAVDPLQRSKDNTQHEKAAASIEMDQFERLHDLLRRSFEKQPGETLIPGAF